MLTIAILAIGVILVALFGFCAFILASSVDDRTDDDTQCARRIYAAKTQMQSNAGPRNPYRDCLSNGASGGVHPHSTSDGVQ
jgi:hypothetical protein